MAVGGKGLQTLIKSTKDEGGKKRAPRGIRALIPVRDSFGGEYGELVNFLEARIRVHGRNQQFCRRANAIIRRATDRALKDFYAGREFSEKEFWDEEMKEGRIREMPALEERRTTAAEARVLPVLRKLSDEELVRLFTKGKASKKD